MTHPGKKFLTKIGLYHNFLKIKKDLYAKFSKIQVKKTAKKLLSLTWGSSDIFFESFMFFLKNMPYNFFSNHKNLTWKISKKF